MAAAFLNLRSFLIIVRFWRKGGQNKRQAMAHYRSTFGAHLRRHCATMAHFIRVPFKENRVFLLQSGRKMAPNWLCYKSWPSYLSFPISALAPLLTLLKAENLFKSMVLILLVSTSKKRKQTNFLPFFPPTVMKITRFDSAT